MKTITLTTYYTKKRSNQKKWDYYREEWQEVNGSAPGKVQLNPRALQVTTKFYNVPDTISTNDLAELWECVIVSTPFGMPIYEHNYNDIVDQSRVKGISYIISKSLKQYKSA
jgi:hypothetical protein